MVLQNLRQKELPSETSFPAVSLCMIVVQQLTYVRIASSHRAWIYEWHFNRSEEGVKSKTCYTAIHDLYL